MGDTIKKYIRTTLLALKIGGLWTESDKFFETKYYWKYSMVLNVMLLGSFNLCQMIYLVLNFDDLELMASTAYLTLTFIMPNIKTYFYLKNWNIIRKLVAQLDQEEFQPKNERQWLKSKQTFRFYFIIQWVYAVLAGILVVLWPLNPLFSKSQEKKLPFLAWYPYDWTLPVLYEITYAHQFIGVSLFLMLNIDLDLISFALTAYVGAECDILADTLQHIYDFTAIKLKKSPAITDEADHSEGSHAKIVSAMNDTLLECIIHHRKLLQFAKDANTFLNILIFSQFASSLLSICLTMFELTISTSVTEITSIAVFQCALFSELMFYCYFGNEAIFKSVNISNALFKSAWQDSSEVYKKNLLFFIIRTQKPIMIFALNFFVLSLPTCTSILRMSWSFFAMLHQTHNKA